MSHIGHKFLAQPKVDASNGIESWVVVTHCRKDFPMEWRYCSILSFLVGILFSANTLTHTRSTNIWRKGTGSRICARSFGMHNHVQYVSHCRQDVQSFLRVEADRPAANAWCEVL